MSRSDVSAVFEALYRDHWQRTGEHPPAAERLRLRRLAARSRTLFDMRDRGDRERVADLVRRFEADAGAEFRRNG